MNDRSLWVLDVDGVVLDFYGGAAVVLEDMLGRPVVQVDPRPATQHRYGLSAEQYQAMRVRMRTHPKGWANLPPLPGAVESVRRWIDRGRRVMFLSSCGASLFEPRRHNLDRLGLADCELVCVEDHAPNAKGEVLERLRPVVFVDDHMKMLAQAPFVPHRVWIDHGCSLEADPASGRPWLENHRVHRVTGLAQWDERSAQLDAPPARPRSQPAFA